MSLAALDRRTGEALYSQISRLLREEIVKFHRPGSLLPSEQALAQRFAVNRHTIRHAIDELVAAGLLERRHGKGTYVLGAPIDYAVGQHTRFTETLEALGKTTQARVLRRLVIPARGGVAQRLALAENDMVIWLETLRLVEDRPFCVISHFLPQRGCEAVYENYAGGSLHEFLARRLGITVRRTDSIISARLPQGDDATLLAMPQNQPVLRVKSINVDDRTGAPIEYSLTRFRADRLQLHVQP